MTKQLPIAIIHRDSIIERVAAGHRLADIAKDLGLAGKGQAISNQLANDPEYQSARESGLAARLDQRESEMEVADREDVPRARELLNHARWRAERECPRRWGAKQEISTGFGQSGVTINIQTVSPTPSVVIDQIEDESPTSDN